jgi:uncharacterized protein Gcw-chp
MKKMTLAAVAAFALSAAPAFAADMPVKAAPLAAPVQAWDLAFGSAVASDYIFRGITQSNHRPSVAAYFEPRYNVNKDLQLYAGLGGASIDFPNRAAAEVDIYGGFRPTFGKLSLDFGVWYYYYPGGKTFDGLTAATSTNGALGLNGFGNSAKSNASFIEGYAKFNYNITDAFVVGGNFYYSPSFLNTGAEGEYLSGTAKYTWTAFSNGVAPYISGEFGRQWLGTSDLFYGNIKYADYNTWNIGVGWTYKVFAVDLRYIDTDLSKAECNAFTGDFNPSGPSAGNVTAINGNGFGSNWCGARFVARLSADLTANTNLK